MMVVLSEPNRCVLVGASEDGQFVFFIDCSV